MAGKSPSSVIFPANLHSVWGFPSYGHDPGRSGSSRWYATAMSDPYYELLKKLNDAAMDRDPERGEPMKMGQMGNGPKQFTAMIIDVL